MAAQEHGPGSNFAGEAPSPGRADLVSPLPTLEEALAELERARHRPYYDEQADAEARRAYYARLPSGRPTFSQLSRLLAATHIDQLPYRPSLHVYPWVDLHPDFTLRSIYSGHAFEPEQLIRDDLRIDALREERLLAMAPLSAVELSDALEQLEALLPYNCEHVVPQSWFARREPMRGDLHHLFTCEAGCNSFRGNTPYFEFPELQEVTRTDCGRRIANKFEPASGKGPVARASLYFLLRYPGEIDRGAAEYDEERVAFLVAWHTLDPVTDWERHRNAAIQIKQGNRNPLVDFPGWAESIDFRQGLG